VLINRKTFSRHLPWFVVFVFGALAAIVWYAIAGSRAQRFVDGVRLPSLAFGFLGGGIIIFEFLLWPRKKLRSLQLGSARRWMSAHIWLGLLSLPLIIMHSGFRTGEAVFGVLMVLYLLVVASGIFGLLLQQILPRYMFDQVPEETADIENTLRQRVVEADELVQTICRAETSEHGPRVKKVVIEASHREPFVIGAARSVRGDNPVHWLASGVPLSELLRHAFDTTIKPYLQHGKITSPEFRNRLQAGRFFRELRNNVDPVAHPVIDMLERWCETRRQFVLQARIHWWLHAWLNIHVPLSAALVTIMLVHAYVAMR
jgi:hypothetical protein